MSKGVMRRDPIELPRKPGIFVLMAKAERIAYVSYTRDLQKRSHSLAHMLSNPKTHWAIRGLPKLPPGSWVFTMLRENITPKFAAKVIPSLKQSMRDSKYKIIDGARRPNPFVTLDGEPMSLPAAMKKAKCKTAYMTVWRRLQRGWTVEQALDLEDTPPRWDHEARKRTKKAA
jgi:hypothetical protein